MEPSARLKNVLCVCSRSSVRSAHRVQPKVLSSVANACFSVVLVIFSAAVLPNFALAQENAGAPTEEIVVNLASGHVVIAVVKDAILIGTVETPIEPQTHVPTPVELGRERVGLILGAIDWFSPSAQKTLGRLDRELPKLHSNIPVKPDAPHLVQTYGGDEAADIEVIGQGLLERLNGLAAAIHGKLDMPTKEPIAQLIIADFLPGYGAEVWTATYTMKQTQQRGDFWATSVLRPVYLQFYPPEKGQPHTLLEFEYPSEDAAPGLASLLQNGDPRISKIKASDPKMAEVAAQFTNGESNQTLAVDALQFLRASLDAIAPPNSRQTIVVIQPQTGVQWILAPPPEPQQPEKVQQQSRPPGAPTLAKPPFLQQ